MTKSMTSKPTEAWCVKVANGNLLYHTMAEDSDSAKSLAIAWGKRGNDIQYVWNDLKDLGWSCVPVEIREVGDERNL